jgi:hypothetical protein
MTEYVGCDYAREHLEGLVDGELSLEQQVAVESHVRWCRTCAARIEDLQLIGESIRGGSPRLAISTQAEPALSAVYSRVLARARAEREQALRSRLREQFTDMRLLWPALGATMAVLVCAAVAVSVLKSTTIERPQSLAMRLEAMGNPGSELNPLRPDNNARIDSYFAKYVGSDRAGGISMPRVLDSGLSVEEISDQEAMFTMATVVSREGRIANAAMLRSERTGSAERGVHADDVEAVLDAVRQSRFAPAQTPGGRAVAVNMVWLFVVTTVQTQAEPTPPPPAEQITRVTPTPRPRRLVPADPEAQLPVGRQSARVSTTPTA